MKKTNYNTQPVLKTLIFVLIAVMHYTVAGQTSHKVDVTNNKFTPAEITISEGDTIIWTNSEGNHNINGMQGTYPTNPESFGNEVAVGWVFSHVFTLEGVYDYQCDPHVRSQMFGQVIVEATLISAVEDFNVTSSLKAYPNPAINEITLVSEFEIASVTILNFAGQTILYTAGTGVKEQTLSLEGFTPGAYLIKVKTIENKLQYSRFIKK